MQDKPPNRKEFSAVTAGTPLENDRPVSRPNSVARFSRRLTLAPIRPKNWHPSV
jgi:hypothetical protein